jgi:uracil-DNA glycosylase
MQSCAQWMSRNRAVWHTALHAENIQFDMPRSKVLKRTEARESKSATPLFEGGQHPAATSFAPEAHSITELREEASGCKACDLWRTATQTVFGEGPAKATIMLIGEQPGDQEDRAGHPFVGPAGKLLDTALAEAGIERNEVYVTNVVKHFKWSGERGKRRIHKKPNTLEIRACRPWLDAEVRIVRPQVVVCLGASAAQSLLGRDFSVSRQRGELVQSSLAPYVTATVHPSSILRAPDDEARHEQMRAFVNDLKKIAGLARKRQNSANS